MSLILSDVRFGYDEGAAPVLDALDLTIPGGQRVALLGCNGSGKSTIARLLNGLLVPQRGRVEIDGLVTSEHSSLPDIRRLLQVVFQNPENQQVGLTIFEDVAFGLANISVPTGQMIDRVHEALAAVGLDLPIDRPLNSLSGGQLQRVALASVMALRPRYLVLDEVTSMLDPESRGHVLESMRRAHRSGGVGLVQITHHLDEVEDADRLVVLRNGRVEADGRPEDILGDHALLAEAGLEAPYRWRRSPTPLPAREDHPQEARLDAALDGVSIHYGAPARWRRKHRKPPTGRPSLDRASLRIGAEIVAIAGRSGAGKSTLVGALKGLRRPVEGAVALDGVDPWEARRPELFDAIGYLLQRPEQQLFAPTVAKDVAFGIREDPVERARAHLAAVGLDPDVYGERSPFELSGGQQRRVALAGVLAAGPRMLILDEPTAGLDLPSRTQVFRQMAALRAEGIGVVWISHQLTDILGVADRLIVLDGGTVVASGDPAVLLADPELRAANGWPLIPELDPGVEPGEALRRKVA